MSEALSGDESIPPKDRTPHLAIKALAAHVEYSIARLHDLCERRGLGPEVESGLRVHLETELESYRGMPQDLTLQQVHDLGEAHFAAGDERDRIAGFIPHIESSD